MKSILKVKIIGVDYYTMKQVTFNKTVTCHDNIFIDSIIPAMKINGGAYELPETVLTAKQQADKWLSNQTDFLNSVIYDVKRELNCIINWEIMSIENIGIDGEKTIVLSAKKEKLTELEKIEILLVALEKESGDFTEDLKNNFLHTYKEMKGVLSGLTIDKKILIILKAMNIGIMASTTAYSRMLDILKKDSSTLDEYNTKKALSK